jgi:hypothetical protein
MTEQDEKKYLEQILSGKFPQGHPGFIKKCIDEIKLHNDKNFDYAADGDPLGNFKRVANILSMYPDLDLADAAIVAMIYALKQIDAYLWLKSNGHTARCEGTSARLRDISVYAKLIEILDDEEIG